MTFKQSIRWHESETMRELERQAVRSGHFDSTPEEKIELAVAKYKEEAPLKVTGDVYVDILALARKLRDKGYEERASELEEKALTYKTAERHLYRVHDEDGEDLLDFAYPDGDIEIAESDEDLGKFWTPQSQQKIIHNVVKKGPKLKPATAAFLIKDVDVKKKTAQEGLEDILQPGGLRREKLPVNEKLQSLYSEMESSVGKAVESLQLNAVADDGSPLYNFSESRLMAALNGQQWKSYLNLYAKLSGVSSSAIADFAEKKNIIYGNRPMSVEAIVAAINSFPSDKADVLRNWAKAAGNFDNFFWGSQPLPLGLEWFSAPKSMLSAENNNSIWKVTANPAAPATGYYVKDSTKVRDVATRIYNAMQQRKDAVFGENIQKANQALNNKLGMVRKTLNSTTFDRVPTLTEDEKTHQAAINDIQLNAKLIYPYTPGKPANKELSSIVSAFGVDIALFNESIKSVAITLNSVYNLVLGETPGKGGVVGDSQVVTTRFAKAANIFQGIIDSVDVDDPIARAARANLETSRDLAATARQAEGKPYAFIYNKIKDVFDYPSWNSFDRFSQQWLTNARADAKAVGVGEEASEANDAVFALKKNDIEKQAKIQPYQPISRQTGAGVSKPRPSGKPTGGTPREADNSEQLQKVLTDVAVELQKNAQSISEKLGIDVSSAVNAMKDTGSPGWGPRVQAALNEVNKLINAAKIDADAIVNLHSRKNTAEEINKAVEHNKMVLGKLANALGLNIDLPGVKRKIVFDRIGDKIEVSSVDLSSPLMFFDFIKDSDFFHSEASEVNDLVKNSQDIEPADITLTVGLYDRVLRIIRNRALNQYRQRQDQLSRQYHEMAENLAHEWQAMKNRTQWQPDKTITINDITGTIPYTPQQKQQDRERGVGAAKPTSSLDGWVQSLNQIEKEAMFNPPFTDSKGRAKPFIDINYLTGLWLGVPKYDDIVDSKMNLEQWSRQHPSRLWLSYAPNEVRERVSKASDKTGAIARWFRSLLEKMSRDLNSVEQAWGKEYNQRKNELYDLLTDTKQLALSNDPRALSAKQQINNIESVIRKMDRVLENNSRAKEMWQTRIVRKAEELNDWLMSGR